MRIRIHFIRIRIQIQHFRLNTDPDPIRTQGFNYQKLKKITAEKKKKFFGSKTTIYLSLGLYKERPSYRRRLQLSKKSSNTSKHELLNKFSTFVGHFCPLGSGSTDPIESGSNPFPQPAVWTCMAYPFPSPAVQGVFREQIKLFCFLSDNERTKSKHFAFVPIISGPNQNVLL